VLDESHAARRQDRQTETALRLLQKACRDEAPLFLFLEDDLTFNRHLLHNLIWWPPLQSFDPSRYFFGSLYNPGMSPPTREARCHFWIAEPSCVFGSQAFVLSLATARWMVERWESVSGMQDIKMSRLAGQVGRIFYHSPSLVQHVGAQSVWGGEYHHADDFSATWRALRAPIEDAERAAILGSMQTVEGWFDAEEAGLLIDVVCDVVTSASPDREVHVVEIGSYCGRSTSVLGLTMKALGHRRARVHAIDTHDGSVTALDHSVMRTAPTYERFVANMRRLGLAEIVVPIIAQTCHVAWDRAIDVLFIDGLHDEASVRADFEHFRPWLGGAYIAFHDCAHYFPGVTRVVDRLVVGEHCEIVDQAKSLIVIRPRGSP
jgi:hypothetical protein